jgi:very-short-patch-repair endonuclease
VRSKTLPFSPSSTVNLRLPVNVQFAMPLNILVGSEDARLRNANFENHIVSGELPNGCFVDCGEGFYVSSPEFCFLQMAQVLPLSKLIRLGFELCGSYRIHGNPKDTILVFDSGMATEPRYKGMTKAEPLTSVKRIESFLEKMTGRKGLCEARRAIKHVLDGSASPMESALAMMLTLPYHSGGYKLPAPVLNPRINVSPRARKAAEKSHYYPDFFWPDVKLAVEYDSDTHHTDGDKIAADATRRNALEGLGITVLTATKRQVFDETEMRYFVEQIARRLGKRMRVDSNPNFAKLHRELRKQLEL